MLLLNKATFFHLTCEYENLLNESLSNESRTKFESIVNNSQFWSDIRFIVRDLFAKPAEIIKIVEGDSVNIGCVYELFVQMNEYIDKIDHHLIDSSRLKEVYYERWIKLDFDCFGFAHILNPVNIPKDRMTKEDYLRTLGSLKNYIRNFFENDLGKANEALHDLNNYFDTFTGRSVEYIATRFDENPSHFWSVYGAKMFPVLATIAS